MVRAKKRFEEMSAEADGRLGTRELVSAASTVESAGSSGIFLDAIARAFQRSEAAAEELEKRRRRE